MIVKVGPDGTIDLESVFTKKTIAKIYSYTINQPCIKVTFFDVHGKQISPKLRKRGKAKKA